MQNLQIKHNLTMTGLAMSDLAEHAGITVTRVSRILATTMNPKNEERMTDAYRKALCLRIQRLSDYLEELERAEGGR